MAKILYMSDTPTVNTGYGIVSRELIKGMIMAGHEVEVIGWSYYGEQHTFPYKIHGSPDPKNDYWGKDLLTHIVNRFEPDILFTLSDPWMVDWLPKMPILNELFWVGYFPIDGKPIPKEWHGLIDRMDRAIVISKFAQDAVREILPNKKVDLLYHGVDREIFKPLPENEVKNLRKSNNMEDKFVCLCCHPETEILMGNMLQKKIINIEVGDLVYTHRGRVKSVTEVFKREYNGDIYNIETYGNYKSLKLTPEHPVYAIKKRGVYRTKWNPPEPDFYEVKDLKKGDYIGIPIPKIDTENKDYIDVLEYVTQFDNVFEENGKIKNGEWRSIPRYISLDKDFMRFCGLFVARGSYYYRDKEYPSGFTLSINDNKTHSRDFIYEYMSKLGLKVHKWKSKNKGDTSYGVSHKLFACLLKELFGEHAQKKSIHKDLLKLKPELLMQFLLGFAEGDGCESVNSIYNTKRNIMVTTSPVLAQQLYTILLSNGIMASINIQKKDLQHHSLRYRVSWFYSQNSTFRFIKDGYIFTKIKNIKTEFYNGNVYNFEVEEDNSYMANYLAVHNCVARELVAA